MVVRNVLYNTQVFNQYHSQIPVICIGNLSVGGTGKTPHVKYLLHYFLNAGKSVGVLSRGYGRKSNGFRWVELNSTFQETGDESIEIKKAFPNAVVAVCESRVNGIKEFEKLQHPPDVVLLDDAFQHRSLYFDYQIVLTTFQNPFYKDFVLPAGRLREPRNGMKRADAIIVTKCPESIDQSQIKILNKKINPEPHQTLLFSTINYEGFYLLESQSTKFTEDVSDYHAYIFTGIANNTTLESELNKHFKKVVGCYLADHHDFTNKNIKQLEKRIVSDRVEKKVVVITEKDATKLNISQFSDNITVLVLRIMPQINHVEEWLSELNESVFINH